MLRSQQMPGGDLFGQHAGEVRRVVGRVEVIGLRDFQRIVEHLLVLRFKPARDVCMEEHARDVKQKGARH